MTARRDACIRAAAARAAGGGAIAAAQCRVGRQGHGSAQGGAREAADRPISWHGFTLSRWRPIGRVRRWSGGGYQDARAGGGPAARCYGMGVDDGQQHPPPPVPNAP